MNLIKLKRLFKLTLILFSIVSLTGLILNLSFDKTDNIKTKINLDSSISKMNFTAKMSLEKKFFLEGETILLHLEITNMSPYSDSIAYLNEYSNHFSIRGDVNKYPEQTFSGDFFYAQKPYIQFNPYETKDYYVTINEGFIYKKYVKLEKSTFFYLPPDNYTVYFSFPLNNKDKKYLCAEALKFYVEEPKGNDKYIFNKLIYFWETGLNMDERKSRIDELDEIFFNNSESIYYETLFREITSRKNILGYKYDTNYVKLALDIIEENGPNSSISQYALGNIVIVYNYISLAKNDKTIFNNYINDIKKYIENKYPNTKLIKTLNESIELHK